jgi:hypothetical protein
MAGLPGAVRLPFLSSCGAVLVLKLPESAGSDASTRARNGAKEHQRRGGPRPDSVRQPPMRVNLRGRDQDRCLGLKKNHAAGT